MRSALAVEWLKARRARMVWMSSLAQVALPPLFALLVVSSSAPDSDLGLGAKATGLGLAPGWAGYLVALGQLTGGWTVITSGLLAAWLFGREFVQGTVASLFATAVPRTRVAAAKLVILMGWGVGCALMVPLTSALLGLVYGAPAPGQLAQLWSVALVVVLTVTLAPIAGLVASWTRSYLPAVGVLISLTVIAQVSVGLRIGGWFPWSIPTLWALPQLVTGPSNANATALMPTGHLSVVALSGAALSLAVVTVWRRLRLA